ncbi:type VI secretion protein [Salmonella enterica subsp. diarizonae]|uniref:Type VI secretion protein n=3 Tax=Salmonella enterica TaxID=28901 RepID=A0A5U9VS54_SALNE|nr:type VI secretion protein [Salmonella enterica subsp. enterica serovar Newport]EAA3937558.1 type VI secretion protein [Salmonella enterica subsp. enterica serovar Bareilly]EAA6552666.1 type VI secretion protein [Salmonella enterica subsp. diarizonae]EAP2905269.1 TrbI/VirB10 family protein [Salmonella enterica]EBN2844008.1 type VI secretion protein [Salmonella enterica]
MLMNDENKVPVPDEVQASPAHAEDDIATLEREARAKREAELLNAQDDEEKDPVQPAVNKLKKRKRGKATAFLAIVAVALIFLAWGGNWVYRNILWQPTEEKKQDTPPQTNKTDYRQRNDLGMAIDAAEEEPEQQDNGQISTAGTGPVTPAAPPEFNKASFLTRRDGSASTQNTVKTRQPQNTAAPSSEQSPAPVRRIPWNPDLYIPENTSIPCSLDRRFVSDRAGKLRCTITTDIWSASGNTKLIEKGTTASLLYRAIAEEGMKHGQGRAFIIATKLRTRQPPYLDIPLVDTSAAGELGEAGVDGWTDSHFQERFGGALMVGMIPDIGAWASNSAGKKDRNTDYTENSRQAMADMARTTLENSINIPPTLYKNQGEIINLITGEDIDFSNIYTLRLKNDR